MASFALSVSRLQARTQPARDLREGSQGLPLSALNPPEVGFWPPFAARETLPGVTERLDSIDTGGAHRPPLPTVSGVPGAADRGLRMWKEHMSDASTLMTAPELSNSPQ